MNRIILAEVPPSLFGIQRRRIKQNRVSNCLYISVENIFHLLVKFNYEKITYMVFASVFASDLPAPQVVIPVCCFQIQKKTLSSYFDAPVHSFDPNEIVVPYLYVGCPSNLKQESLNTPPPPNAPLGPGLGRKSHQLEMQSDFFIFSRQMQLFFGSQITGTQRSDPNAANKTGVRPLHRAAGEGELRPRPPLVIKFAHSKLGKLRILLREFCVIYVFVGLRGIFTKSLPMR